MAAASEPLREVLYAVSPTTAQYFTPVQRACVSNGIRMEVVACYIHDDTAELYVALQDLEGDRVDETTDLFDSYTIRRPYDTKATCSLVHYDASAGTAVFRIQITQWGGHPIEGSKITFQVREFLSHKTIYEDVEIPLSLSNLGQVQTQTADNITGGSGAASLDDAVSVLCPGAAMEGFPVQGIDLTAAGYVNGQLHVQTAVRDALQNDNHGFVQLQGRKENGWRRCIPSAFAINGRAKAGWTTRNLSLMCRKQKLGSISWWGRLLPATCGRRVAGA